MDFKQFLAAKQALALVEHMQTLSEADAQQLFDTLDEETVEFIEAVLSETSAGTVKRMIKKGRQQLASGTLDPDLHKAFQAAEKEYEKRTGSLEKVNPARLRNLRRASQQLTSRINRGRRENLGQPETRKPVSE